MRTETGRRGRRHHHRHHEHDGPVRLRHGDVRAALLVALQEGPAHGYELGQRLERISSGAWKPSPGSIYPTLQTLADEDCVSSIERDGKRVYTIEKKGTVEVKEREARGDASPWLVPDGGRGALRDATHALRAAVKQIAVVGNATQQERAFEIVTDARKRLYELLVNE
jgi:DNA-binding PadR family transcriptional regulator